MGGDYAKLWPPLSSIISVPQRIRRFAFASCANAGSNRCNRVLTRSSPGTGNSGAISHSGATHETVAATRLAKEAGARTIVITNFARSPIQAYADVVLFTMARETRFRTEAMTSRIAQLCVADALIAALALDDYDRSTETLRQTFEVLSIKRF